MNRKMLLTLCCVTALSVPAHAAEPSPVDDVLEQTETTSAEIAQRYIEEKYCDQPAPEPQENQIVIYYERDENNKCVARYKTSNQQDAQTR